MEEIRVNRLPAITWRYLHVNDSPDQFELPGNSAAAVFSDRQYVSEGGVLPAGFRGASAETLAAAEKGQAYTVTIPEKTEAELMISITAEEDCPDFAGCFIFKLEKDAKLNLIWRLSGNRKTRHFPFPILKRDCRHHLFMNSGVRFSAITQNLILFPPNWAGRRSLSTVTEDWWAAGLK